MSSPVSPASRTESPSTRPGSEPALPGAEIGPQVGDYLVLDLLGRGATGGVYRALHPQLARHVALKVIALPPADAARDAASLRVLHEGRALARLRHANVVTVHDVGEAAGHAYLAMELVDGTTLRTWCAETRSRAARLAALIDAGRGLAAVHDAGLVHRDVKPDNVLIARDGRVVLGDFGLARLIDAALPGEAAAHPAGGVTSTITSARAAVGTLPYMAPEVIAGGAATPASDQFSFCVMAFECLYGRRPFDGASADELYGAIARQQIGPVAASARLPARAHAALLRGLRADPAERFAELAPLLDALAAATRARRRRIMAMALAAGSLAALGAVWSATSGDSPAARCAGAARWDGVWDRPRRFSIQQAFFATGVPYAPQAFHQVEVALDRYTATWSERARQLCLVDDAGAVAGTPAASVVRDELACLRRRREDVARLADSLASPRPALIAIAPRLAFALRPLLQCQIDPDTAAPPRRAEDSAAIAELQSQLASAVLAYHAGDLAGAERLARGVIARVAGLDVALLTESTLLLGSALRGRGRDAEATDTFFSAATAAESAGLYALAAEGWLALAERARASPPEDPGRWFTLAEIATKRAGNQPELAAAVESERALELIIDGQIDQALVHQRRAAALLEAQVGSDDLRVVSSNYSVALGLAMAGRCAEAEPLMRDVVAARARLLSPTHPDTLDAVEMRGICLHRLDRPAEAVPLLGDALRAREAELGPDAPGLARSLGNLAGALHALHRDEEALVLLRRAVSLRSEGPQGKLPRLAKSLVNLGTVLVALGRTDEALAPLRQARDLFESPESGRDVRNGGYARIELANALSRLHREREALAELAPFEQPGMEALARQAGQALVARGHALLGLGERAAAARALQQAAAHPTRPRWEREVEDQLVTDLARCGFVVPSPSGQGSGSATIQR